MLNSFQLLLIALLVTIGGHTHGRRLVLQADFNLSGALQGCTDIPPTDSGKTCAEHKAAGDCNQSVTTSRNYCAATCGRCDPGPAPATAAASPAPTAEPVQQTTGTADAEASAPEQPAGAAPIALQQEPQPAPSSPAPAPEQPAPASKAALTPTVFGNSATAPSSSGSDAGAAPAPTALPGTGQVFKGDGTAYSEKVDNTGEGFACSYRYVNDYFSTHFAAVNALQWDEGAACGRCATVWCVDSRCKTQDRPVTVMIVDKCPECKHGDLDLSIPVYREISGMWPHRLTFEWQWSDCSSFINGTIRIAPKDGANPFWRGFYFSNMKYPLARVTLDGHEMVRSEYQFFSLGGGLGPGPYKFVFEAVNGERTTAVVEEKDLLTDHDLGVQFDEFKSDTSG